MRGLVILMLVVLTGLAPAGPASAQQDPPQDILAIPGDEPPAAVPAPATPEPDKAAQQETEGKALAIQYFDRCTQEALLEQDFDTRALFCSCSADRALQILSREQLAALATGKGFDMDPDEFSARIQAPCLSYPLEKVEYSRCLSHSKNLFVTFEAHQRMCQCASVAISNFVRDYGDQLMAMILKRRSVRQEPLHDLTWSREYKNELHKIKTACINQFAGQ